MEKEKQKEKSLKMRLLRDISFMVNGREVKKIKDDTIDVVGRENIQKMLRKKIAVPADLQFGGPVTNRFLED